jgi:hypothetical protein
MIPQEFETAVYAAVAGLTVGGIIKLINKFIDSDKTELSTHILLRKELREELDAVKAELHDIKLELDEWKHKYFRQMQLTNELKLEIITLTDDFTEHKKRTGSFLISEEEVDLPLDI